MNSNSTVILGLFCILLASVVKGQTSVADEKWRVYLSEDKDVSISLPYSVEVMSDNDKIVFFDFKNRDMTSDYIKESKHIIASVGGGTFRFSSYKISGSKEAPRRALDHFSPRPSFIAFNRQAFVGRAFSMGETGYILEQVVFATKGRAYHLIAGSRQNDNAAVRKVLRSLKLNGETVYDSTSPSAPSAEKKDSNEIESEVLIATLADTPFNYEVGPALEKQQVSKTPVEIVKKESVTALKILVKPKAGYTDSARANNQAGVIHLRISFGSDGKIAKIIRLGEGLKFGLNEKAIRAARLVTFLPAENDGKPVSVEKTFEYVFSIY